MAKKRRGKRGARQATAPRRKTGRKKAVVRKAVRRKAPRAKAPKKRPARKRSPPKRRAVAAALPPPIAVDVAEQEALRAKFELGPHEWTRELDAREKAQTIPWGYGRDRVTAMAVDPERLFVYWEVTDEAIARARAALAADEAGTLTLRVHDVTGLLFDGDNAHHSFDLDVGRAERQRFHHVGRPTSSVIVELGLRAGDGRFAAIVRSRRVDFPRRDPAPPGPIEWLTVREESFAPRHARLAVTPASPPSPPPESRAAAGARRAATAGTAATPATATLELDRGEFQEWFVARFGPLAWAFDGDEFEWLGPGGAPEEAGAGPVLVSETDGVTRIELPPWSVTLADDDGRGARRLLARWQLRRAWMVHSAGLTAARWRRSLRATTTFTASDSAASEQRLAAAAALELGGASERTAASFPTLPPPPAPR